MPALRYDSEPRLTRDFEADPAEHFVGVLALIEVQDEPAHSQQAGNEVFVLVREYTPSQIRWNLPGGAWGQDTSETPVDTARRLLKATLGRALSVSPRVLLTDWVPNAASCPPGIVVVLDGGVITSREAALLRPIVGTGAEEVRFVLLSELGDPELGIDAHTRRRIEIAAAARRDGRWTSMTTLGVPAAQPVHGA
ncbi:hypothetical protein ACFV1L_05940 [Kitasatospora sp. NPDC059646]|uniref:hypothetical protein n=1 Tax=Kitasatospora sp. NPDC059646 TaxID=3346893 RepID=UPI00368B88E2